ncbi:LacI family DNA-binding transcriptional regulator [Actinoplanes bogorensis]|uniref:LacI family DNA-binding transcriptional regulator n=1 Tax=Paractinoplanes bogorensis TaxID=1610840 RepID=A0ABS5YXF4_9ACTN|nr:LacI family DNA-binding transcriptional regulator [Actinoplanes bogorensis]MBU2668063.1 LacI family DNA-binding transcriptional regulator [Actinoplanes bogorensis]
MSRPKMVDVGRLAGVSAQTVSRYYTGKGYVGAETRARIEAAIDELNYQFNGSARSLRVNATRTVGVLTTGPSVYGTWSIHQGLNEAAHRDGYAVFSSWVAYDAGSPRELHDALDRFLSARVDGIIISSPHPGIEDTLRRVWETVPVVILSGHAWPNADSATVDSYEAALLATRHLIGLGHRRILHIAGPEEINEAQDRERGYRDALSEVAAAPLPVVRGDWSAQSGYQAGSTVDVRDFSAVFSGNDQMALGFMNALRGRGLVAPDDYSIAGVDDMPDARHFAPPLTTVWMDFVELGRTGFRMLTERITTGERVARQVIHPHLVTRDSTGPAPVTR